VNANNTFCTNGCPADPGNPSGTPGWTIWIENNNCTFSGNGTYNSPTSGGFLIDNKGRMTFTGGGNGTFYGVIYAVNDYPAPATPLTGYLITFSGNIKTVGAVAADGPGGLDLGNSNNSRVTFDPSVIGPLSVNGAAGIVQNTWRQIQ
jgi:hypothetical protein